MSSELYVLPIDSAAVKITDYVNIIRQREPLKVENRLLDGTFHVQTVGVPAKILKVDASVLGYANQDLLDYHAAIGSRIQIIIDDYYWIGYIRGVLSWSKATIETFTTTFDLMITEEGAV